MHTQTHESIPSHADAGRFSSALICCSRLSGLILILAGLFGYTSLDVSALRQLREQLEHLYTHAN